MEWSKALKIAIVEENEQAIEELINTLPHFDTLEKMQEAAYLMKEAHTYLSTQKDATAKNLIALKKQREFIHTNLKPNSSFDKSL